MDTPKYLGQSSALPASPDAAELDYVPNPRSDELYLVRFAAPELPRCARSPVSPTSRIW